MPSVSSSIGTAEAEARAAVSLIDGRFGTIFESARARSSLGTKELPSNPLGPVKMIRAELADRLRKAKAHITKAKAHNALLAALADAIAASTPIPPDTPANLAEYASKIAAGHRLGSIDRAEVAAELRASVKEAEARIAAAEKLFRRFESAAAIGAARGEARYLKLFPELTAEAAKLESRADWMSHIHRIRYGSIKKLAKAVQPTRTKRHARV